MGSEFLVLIIRILMIIGVILAIRLAKKIRNIISPFRKRIETVFLVNLFYFLVIFILNSLLKDSRQLGWTGIGYLILNMIILGIFTLSFLICAIIIAIKPKKKHEDRNLTITRNKFRIFALIMIFLLFYGAIISTTAKITNIPQICLLHPGIGHNSKLFGNTERNFCLLDIAREQKDIKICYLMNEHDYGSGVGTIKPRSTCFFELAPLAKDSNGCDNIFGRKRDECKILIDPSFGDDCNNLREELGRKKCFLNQAISKSEPSICKNIKNDAEYANCIVKIAEKIGNVSMCSIIKNSLENDVEFYVGVCYEKLSASTGNKALCENIKDERRKQLCKLYGLQ